LWDLYYADRNAVNLGISGDRTQHVLWRLENGNVAGINPKLAVLMIGTNNAADNTAVEIADGIEAVVRSVREKLPYTRVLLLSVFPREEQPGTLRAKLTEANALVAASAEDDAMVTYLDVSRWFLDDAGVLPAAVMPDFLHPNERGYAIWAHAIEPAVALLLDEVNNTTPPKGYVPLFNGEDLTGWQGLVENPEVRARMQPAELADAQVEADALMRQHWRVEEGTLFFDGNGSHLLTNRDYGDFELLVDWRIEEEGGSGIYLRGVPQVQIGNADQWPKGSGGLFNNKEHPSEPLIAADRSIGEWNTFRILMTGEKVTVYLNNVLVVDNTVLENFWNRDQPLHDRGPIELQGHDSKVWFRNIFVRAVPRDTGTWEPLFDGESLDGWQPIDSSETSWGAESNVLYTTGEGGGWLSTTREFSDFDLALDYRVPDNGNSGVFIRAPHEGNPAFAGSEIQVLDDYGDEYTELEPWQYTASIYNVVPPARRVTRAAGEWQTMRIRAVGPHVQVWVNGLHVVDANLNDHLDKLEQHPGLARTTGFLGLQNHGSRLDYHNIRIQDLGR